MKEFFNKDNKQDKIEIVKQQIKEIQTIFDSTILPKKNHKLFEINLSSGHIVEAEFDEIPPLRWEDAIKGDYIYRRKVTKKENCIRFRRNPRSLDERISAMNENNVRKILRRNSISLS